MKTLPTLLVTGSSGQLGRQTVEFLLKSGKHQVIAGSRATEKIADLGAETRTVDFDRPETLASAFAGVDRLLLVSTDSLEKPGQRIAQHRAAIAAAVDAGVQHIVYTSVINAVPDSAAFVTPDHFQTEQAIIASGLDYTILRNGLYVDNLLGALPGIIASGQWHHAAGTGKIALVTRHDCARIAAAALEADLQGKRILDVTGPQLATYTDTAALVSEIVGQPISAVALDTESLVAGLVSAGFPEPIARVLASFDTAQANGEYDVLSSAIEDLTGSAPTSVREFLTARKTQLLG